MLFDVINSRSALFGPGNDGQRFGDLKSIIYTDVGREEFGRGIAAFWRTRNRRRAGRVPARVLAALPAVEPHRIGRKMPAGLLGHFMEEARHRRGYATVTAEV